MTEWSSAASPARPCKGRSCHAEVIVGFGKCYSKASERVSVCLYNFGNYEESDVKAFEEEL